MVFEQSTVHGAWLVGPTPHVDGRGRFMRAWCLDEFRDHGIDFQPVQANMAFSSALGTVRGLHYQVSPALEAKLVRCTRGSVFDVLVDLRPDSETYRTWFGAMLTADNGRMMYVPEGCAHGCQSTEEDTEIFYLTSTAYSPNQARGLRYDDPAIGIRWPLPATAISDQDRAWPLLEAA